MPIDFLGNEIHEGDTVIFPHSNGVGKLVKGIVLSISKKQCQIKCEYGNIVSKDFKTNDTKEMPEIVRRNYEHIAVVKV